MDDFKKIQLMIERAADYLFRNRICPEDHLAHNGRRAYVWPLLKWLWERDPKPEYLERMKQVAEEMTDDLKRNPTDELVIFPGLQHRRNYSSNAIDCGIFVDSFYDFLELLPGGKYPLAPLETLVKTEAAASGGLSLTGLEPKVSEVATVYNFKKITGFKDTHDQYLWAATGLAHWYAYHSALAGADKYRRALEETLDFWLSFEEKDGYGPYMNTEKYMGGLTPYYFSRRIAFSWYILEKIKLNRPDLEEKLARAANFLIKLHKPDGLKAMDLEAKRYYFWGPYEAGSNPFDIYVFAKMFEKTKNDFWLEAASISLKHLIKSQLNNGALRNRPPGESLRDWQCDTMRTGHLAWLARLPDEFLKKISERKIERLTLLPDLPEAGAEDRLILMGGREKWFHFVTRKGPLAGYSGERISGLIVNSQTNINNLSAPYLFQYRAPGNPWRFLVGAWPGIIITFRYVFWHAWDCLFHRRAFALAWAFIRYGLLDYLWVGLFTRGTEFATEIQNLKLGKNNLTHDLVISDFEGSQKKVIGWRELSWNEQGKIKIEDEIMTTDRLKVFLPARLSGGPNGPMKIRSPKHLSFSY